MFSDYTHYRHGFPGANAEIGNHIAIPFTPRARYRCEMIRLFNLTMCAISMVLVVSTASGQETALQIPGDGMIKVIGSDDSASPVNAVFQSGLDAYYVQDYAAARAAWSELSDADHAISMHNHAVMLWRGQGGTQDRPSAVALFEKSGALENPVSLHALGTLSMNGWGVAKDADQAVAYFEQASVLGHGPSTYNLAVMYWNGVAVEADKDVALEYFEAAAEGDYVRAQYDLAGLLYDGSTGRRDFKAARSWFERAAENDDPFARYNLALMALAGEGGPVDKDLAHEQLVMSANAGTVPAQMRLAGMLATGEHGEAVDLVSALSWYLIADAFGAEGASENAKMIEDALSPSDVAKARAKALQFKPASNNPAPATASQ